MPVLAVMALVVLGIIWLVIHRAIHRDAKATGLAPLTRNQLRTMGKKARQQGVRLDQVNYKPRRRPYR